MSRRSRDEAAAALAVAEVTRRPPDGPALVLEDPRPDVAAALAGAAVEVEAWSRYGSDRPWPAADGARALVALRLPRARRELEMLLHLAAGALRPEGRLLVYGANDEGVKSVARHLDPFFEAPVTLATGGHARLVGARRGVRADAPRPRVTAEAWRSEIEVALPWGRRRWVSFPGVFAHGRVDEGTALLLEHLPPLSPGARVLDYGAGSGFLAAGALAASPDARVTALEPDALAAAATRANVPEAEVVVGGGWGPLGDRGPWDVVLANPPYHRGKEETVAEIEAFLRGLPHHLAVGGVMRCVVQRRLPFEERALAAGSGRISVIADRGAFRIWEVRR